MVRCGNALNVVVSPTAPLYTVYPIWYETNLQRSILLRFENSKFKNKSCWQLEWSNNNKNECIIILDDDYSIVAL